MPKKAISPFAHHALERICERYGIRLTKKQQVAFGRTLTNPKHTIQLTRNRVACHFEGKWYLLACNVPIRLMPTRHEPLYKRQHAMPPCRMLPCTVTVQTFLRLEDATDDDKQILRYDERYLKTNKDAFHVLSASRKSTKLAPRIKRMVELPDDLTDDELPRDEIQSAENMLKSYCDSVR